MVVQDSRVARVAALPRTFWYWFERQYEPMQ